MAKYILTDGYVEINGVDLSSYAHTLDTPQEKERVDVSGWTNPDDVQGDSLTTLRTNEQGDLADVLVVKEGYLPSADGTEDDD